MKRLRLKNVAGVNRFAVPTAAPGKSKLLSLYLDFCVLSPEQRKQLLSVFYNCLKDNGSILFDVNSITAYANIQESSSFKRNLMDGF